VALDGLGHEAFLADPSAQNLRRNFARTEAGDLDAAREIGGRVLDRVTDVLARHIHLEANLVVGELFDLDSHLTIQAKGLRLPSAGVSRCQAWGHGLEPAKRVAERKASEASCPRRT